MGKPDWTDNMIRFQAYCRQNGKLYTYEGVSNTILCLESGIWSIIAVLPEEAGGQIFTTISIYGDNLYLYGWEAEYIIRNHLRDKSMEVIKLHGDWRDEKGFFFSNLLVNGDEIILLPFRQGQARVFDCHGNTVLKDWQMNFADSMEKLRRDCGMAQIRAWGAYLADGRIIMVFTDFKRDKLAIYHISEQRLELVPVGIYEKLFHLEYCADRFYIQGIDQSDFQIARIDLSGRVFQTIRMKAAAKELHMQWIDSGKYILLEEDRLVVVDVDFKAREILLVSDEGEKLEYVHDSLFISRQGRIYYFDSESGRFCRFQMKADAGKMLLASVEYRQRMVFAMRKWSERGSIGEIGIGMELKTFIEMIPKSLQGMELQSNIGEAIWNTLIQ